VTADGSTLVIDDGTQDFSLWALGLPEALKGKFVDTQRLAKASTRFRATDLTQRRSPLIARNLPTSTGGSERRYSIRPFDGGSETPLNLPGSPRDASWVDSVTLAVSKQTATGIHVGLVDVRSGAAGRSIDIADSLIAAVTPLADGMAWIPATKDRVVVQRGGKTIEIRKAGVVGELNGVAADAMGSAWRSSAGTPAPTTPSVAGSRSAAARRHLDRQRG